MLTVALAVKASACRRARIHSAPAAPGAAGVSIAGKGTGGRTEASRAEPRLTHSPADMEGEGVEVSDTRLAVEEGVPVVEGEGVAEEEAVPLPVAEPLGVPLAVGAGEPLGVPVALPVPELLGVPLLVPVAPGDGEAVEVGTGETLAVALRVGLRVPLGLPVPVRVALAV